jgi:hypothetical protein
VHTACPCEPGGCIASTRSVISVVLDPAMCVLVGTSTIVGKGRHSAAGVGRCSLRSCAVVKLLDCCRTSIVASGALS